MLMNKDIISENPTLLLFSFLNRHKYKDHVAKNHSYLFSKH